MRLPFTLLFAPALAGGPEVLPVLLGGAQRFFYNLSPDAPDDATGRCCPPLSLGRGGYALEARPRSDPFSRQSKLAGARHGLPGNCGDNRRAAWVQVFQSVDTGSSIVPRWPWRPGTTAPPPQCCALFLSPLRSAHADRDCRFAFSHHTIYRLRLNRKRSSPSGSKRVTRGHSVESGRCRSTPDEYRRLSHSDVSSHAGSEVRKSRGDRIRTCDLLVPNQALYQAKLRPEFYPNLLGSLSGVFPPAGRVCPPLYGTMGPDRRTARNSERRHSRFRERPTLGAYIAPKRQPVYTAAMRCTPFSSMVLRCLRLKSMVSERRCSTEGFAEARMKIW